MQRWRLPRFVYWIAGASIACIGAVLARLIALQIPEHRIAIWLVGAAVIFVGLSVLSLGTKAHLEGGEQDTPLRR